MQLHHTLRTIFRDSPPIDFLSQEKINCYGLADHALLPNLVQKLKASNTTWTNVFGDTSPAETLAVAPILFHLDPTTKTFHQEQLTSWLAQPERLNQLILIATPLSLPVLAHGLHNRLDASLEPDLDMLLRYYDPHVFLPLIGVFTDTQKQSFLSIAQAWFCPNRQGQMQRYSSEFIEHDLLETPIKLSQAQEDALLEANLIDQVTLQMGALDEDDTTSFRRLSAQEQYQQILAARNTAKMIDHQNVPDIVLICQSVHEFGTSTAKLAAWQALLPAIKENKMSLSDALRQAAASPP